jgi:hypothetical protein
MNEPLGHAPVKDRRPTRPLWWAQREEIEAITSFVVTIPLA